MIKTAGPAAEVVDRTDQLDTADTAMKTEDTAVWAVDDTAVAVDDVDDTAAAGTYFINIRYESFIKLITIISFMWGSY